MNQLDSICFLFSLNTTVNLLTMLFALHNRDYSTQFVSLLTKLSYFYKRKEDIRLVSDEANLMLRLMMKELCRTSIAFTPYQPILQCIILMLQSSSIFNNIYQQMKTQRYGTISINWSAIRSYQREQAKCIPSIERSKNTIIYTPKIVFIFNSKDE